MNPESQFFIEYDDSNISEMVAMIIGPPDTPYAYGMFLFIFHFPDEYPQYPPKVRSLTTNNGLTRFNPNIYSNGRVCLSILGTWSGSEDEKWNSAHGILSVLVSVQSLLGENPYYNEPGYQKAKAKEQSDLYNLKVIHETIRLSVIEKMEALYNGTASKYEEMFEFCTKTNFACYYNNYSDQIAVQSTKVQNQNFFTAQFESKYNGMLGSFDYKSLKQRLDLLFEKYLKETQEWKNPSDKSKLMYLSSQFLQLECEMAEIEIVDQNYFHWILTVYGGFKSCYEGGVFEIEIVFNTALKPRSRFLTPFFHPNVNKMGIPYIKSKNTVQSHVDSILALFEKEPNPDPYSNLNSEAYNLFFNDKKEFLIRAKQCAEKSIK